jgi:hypothetical protein
MHIQVDKDIKTKVKGNIQTECNGKREIMLDGSDFLDVKQSQTINITDDYGLNIKGDMGLDVKGPETKLFFNSADTEITFKKLDTTVNGDHKDMVTGNKHISSNAGMKINCPKKLIINTPIQQVSGDVRAGSGDVSLITHVHRQNNGKRDAGGGIDTAPSTGGTAPGS